MACLHISSPTLRSIGFSALSWERKNWAPKLEILGPLSPLISEIKIANLVLQGLIPASLSHTIHTVKVLALYFCVPDLNVVIDVLRCFPCLEKLYVINQYLKAGMKNVHRHDPLDPVKCLETHLKFLVLKNYRGNEEEVGFAKFFVLNAKVVHEILFGVNEKIDKKWVADQHMLLGVETKVARDAQFVFRSVPSYFNEYLDMHDLSVADPFNLSFADGVDALSGEACR
ncbi:hypothetical protein ACQ4PT_033905 [Festuca glaucescens]